MSSTIIQLAYFLCLFEKDIGENIGVCFVRFLYDVGVNIRRGADLSVTQLSIANSLSKQKIAAM